VLLLAVTPAAGQLTLRLTDVPGATPRGAPIYVAGSFNRWNPGDTAYRLVPSGGAYAITLPDWVRGPIEFKFTLGSWETVETDSAGKDVANRRVTIPLAGAATWTGAVGGWHDPRTQAPKPSTASKNVSVLSPVFAMPQLGRTRRVWVYLPPDYASSRRRYPVLYMQDGQNVFDAATSFSGEWGVDETLDSLHALGDRGVIVVAVDNGGDRRLDEYSTWRNARYGGGEGAAYAEFLVNTLKPYVDAHFRTLADRRHTGIAGSSMGGLISLYAALRYPRVFGRAGIFSPSLWFAPEVYDLARRARPVSGNRIYFVMGAKEGDTPDRYVRDQQRMIGVLRSAGFRAGTDVRAFVRPDGAHSEWFWRREFPAAYEWLFGGPSSVASSRTHRAGRSAAPGSSHRGK
jgi:metallo-beta-lactamase class B